MSKKKGKLYTKKYKSTAKIKCRCIIGYKKANIINISKFSHKETLFIVSCTKTKIWDKNPSTTDFAPARCAYKGSGFKEFIEWLENNKVKQKGFYWVILSGKYGFIEPDHPISRYDVYLGNEKDGPISDENT